MLTNRMPKTHRLFTALLVVSGLLLLTFLPWSVLGDTVIAAGSPPEKSTDHIDQDDPPAASECEPVTTHVAGAESVPAGETVALTLTVSAGCPIRTPAVHIAVIIDSTIDRSTLENVKSSAERWIRTVVKSTSPHHRATVIEFAGSARRVCPMTNDVEDAVDCLNRIRAGSGATRTDLGIKEGVATLRKARNSAGTTGEIFEAFTLYTNAKDEDCNTIEREAKSADRLGIRFYARCADGLSSDCDRECVSNIADQGVGPGTSFLSPGKIAPLRLQTLLITDTFPANIQFVDGSAKPAPAFVAPDLSSLRWNATSVSSKVFNLMVRPSEVGTWPVSAGPVQGTFVDRDGGVGTLEFDVPQIEVLPSLERPTDPPTPTLEPTDVPSPTATSLPATSTPELPTDTPVPDPQPKLFMPWAFAGADTIGH